MDIEAYTEDSCVNTPDLNEARCFDTKERAQDTFAPVSDSMDSTLVKALAWTGGIKWAVQLLSWASILVMARLLSPSDYGIVGMSGVYILTISYIAECGIGTAIITARRLSPLQLAQMNTLALLLGVAAMVVSWGAAKPLSCFFHTPVIARLLLISSVTMVTESARSVPYAWLSKQMSFRFLAMAEALRALVFTVVSLVLALWGWRYWALVAANILGSTAICIAILRKAQIPYRRPQWACIRDLMIVGRNIMIGNLAWYGYSNADFFTAGRWLGTAPLGAYSNAWTVANAPIEKIASIANRVTPSFFAALADDDSGLRRYVLRLTEVLALLLFPALWGLALVSREFVLLAFGAKWNGMVTPLRLLAVYAAFNCLSTIFSPIINAKSHSRFTRNLSIVALLILPTAFYVACRRYGTVGIAGVWVTLFPLLLLPSYIKMSRLIHLPLRDYLRSIGPALSGTAWMAAVVCSLKLALPRQSPLALRFTAVVCAGATTYIAAIFLLHRSTANRLWQSIRTNICTRQAADS